MRKLASIQRIDALTPIEGRDRIVRADVLGWHVIVGKDEYKVGDLCVYVEIDSVLPEKPEFEFLRQRKFRIKTIKMGGQVSQGICFPLSILPEKEWKVGDDVTDVIGVTHYDEYGDQEKATSVKQDPVKNFLFRHRATRWLARRIYGTTKKVRDGFPEFISKTDETRIQCRPDLFTDEKLHSAEYQLSEKADGSSSTYIVLKNTGFAKIKRPYEFIVCSRNRRLYEDDGSVWWEVAKKYNIEKALKHLIGDAPWVCIQGEIIGPKIQGNPYKLTEPKLKCFNLIYPDREHPMNPIYNKFVDSYTARTHVEREGLEWVPLLDEHFHLPDTCDEMVEYADAKSVLADVDREGVVVRNYELHQSFKAVSNKYLLKHERD